MIFHQVLALIEFLSVISAQRLPYNSQLKAVSDGGLVGHGDVSSGGLTGNSGLQSFGGFVGHGNIQTPTSGGFVGHGAFPSGIMTNGDNQLPVAPGDIVNFRSNMIHSPVLRFARAASGYSPPSTYARAKLSSEYSSSYGSSYSVNNRGSRDYYQPSRISNDYSASNHDESPKPYQYSFETNSDGQGEAKWSQEEKSHEDGVVIGSYKITGPYGLIRIVNYRADQDGFYADIQTNEPGMVDSNLASASIRTISGSAQDQTYQKNNEQYPNYGRQ